MLKIGPEISIPDAELHERFLCAPGPGGQNVNKVATAVQLSLDIQRSPSLPDTVKARLLASGDRRISGDGVITVHAHRLRTRERNRADARARLVALIQRAAQPQKPRKPTKPSLGAKRRRLDAKRQRGQIKTLRRGISSSD